MKESSLAAVDPAPGKSAEEAGTGHARSGSFSPTALVALYTLTLRQHLHGKRWLVLGALFLTPAVIAGAVRATAPDVPGILLEFLFAYMLIPQALLPLVALLYGSGILQDEQEEQTFTYILVRPISKWAIYVTKLLGALTTAVRAHVGLHDADVSGDLHRRELTGGCGACFASLYQDRWHPRAGRGRLLLHLRSLEPAHEVDPRRRLPLRGVL